jgi:hypothetical protein
MPNDFINIPSSDGIDGLTGDVTATGPGTVHATVNSIGGATASTAATADTIVKRDSDGEITVAGVVQGNYAYKVSEVDLGNGGSSKTIDLSTGSSFKLTLNDTTCTITLSNPQAGGVYVLRLIQDATGSRAITWPAAVKWPGAAAPTLSGASKIDLVNLYYDGTSYYGSFALNY